MVVRFRVSFVGRYIWGKKGSDGAMTRTRMKRGQTMKVRTK